MNGQATSLAAIPDDREALFQKIISATVYPHDLFPRQWFPDLDAIVGALLRSAWAKDPAFKHGLLAADEAQAGELLAARLGLLPLLDSHPRSVVMIYRQLISGFIHRLHRRQDESQDILQEVFARLFSGKLANIQRNFDSKFNQTPRFTSYFMVCIRNMYVDIVREGRNLLMKRDDVPQQVLEMGTSGSIRTGHAHFLDDEFAKLRAILRLHPFVREKMELCLKLKCRFAVTAADVKRCFPACSPDDIIQLSADFRNAKDRELYQAIIPVFNRHEPKTIKADTLRKWVENKAKVLITHLNRMHHQTIYDQENLSDLLNFFFTEEAAHE
jgi:hypothetical protein